jgi:hypothetical protein
MIRKPVNKKIVINLDGPMGNAFALLAEAKGIMRSLKWSKEKQSEVIDLMKLGDYINLIKTFDSFFGNIITLETNNESLLEKTDA